MSIIGHLVSFGLRQAIGESADKVVSIVEGHWTDHGQALPQALANANDKAWQALGVALAGDGFLDRLKGFFGSADDRGVRQEVSRFLQSCALSLEGSPADFRKACLAELQQARKEGMLSAQNLVPAEVARRTAGFPRLTDPTAMVDGAWQAIGGMADEFRPRYPHLANLLHQRTPAGPPLLAAAFAYFFQCEIRTKPALATVLLFDGLRQLSVAQENAFKDIGLALENLGDQFDQLLEEVLRQLDRIEIVGIETKAAVLDIQTQVHHLLAQAGMQRGEVRPHHSFSIRGEEEKRVVLHLLARFRQLPPAEQKLVPDLLNGLGKLQIGTGDFAGAGQTFVEVAQVAGEPGVKAEALFNAYRAALEEKKWPEALDAILQAAALNPKRFEPFPLKRYRAERILGAGGFGTAFLCHDANFDEQVVVKTLHAADMERNLAEVFREAIVLKKLSHPAIIGVQDCEYADRDGKQRPYIVMEYFPGQSLEGWLKDKDVLPPEALWSIAGQIADGMRAAHAKGILHRDLKPDNVLVYQEGGQWQVKVIDFGLALRRQTIETSLAVGVADKTVLGASVTGTMKYAPPEQKGEMPGVKPGPYSDVYSFGKLCCYALFRTTEPKDRHWGMIAEDMRSHLKKMLDQCREEELDHRFPNFEPVLAVLDNLDRAKVRQKLEEQDRQRRQAEEQRQRDEQQRAAEEKRQRENADRQQRELVRIHQDGETQLARQFEEVLNRTQGKPTAEDQAAFRELLKRHRLPRERAQKIVNEVREQWQKAHPPAPQPGDVLTNSIGMKLVLIPPGKFQMGSPKEEEGRFDDEKQHEVEITRPFYLGVYEVTQEEYQKVMGTTPSYFSPMGGGKEEVAGKDTSRYPVEQVSWEKAREFCRKLSGLEAEEAAKRLYRLPTEAEWEYACRGGAPESTPFHFGHSLSQAQANFHKGGHLGRTTEVGSYEKNGFGLYDMHGNVWEWCADWYGEYRGKKETNPKGPSKGSHRVYRGGSWTGNGWYCRAANRGRYGPVNWLEDLGFRLALDSSGG